MRKIIASLLAIGVLAAPAVAEDDPDAVIKFRKGVMKAVGGATGNIAAVLKGEIAAKDQLGALVAILAAASDKGLTTVAFRPDTHEQGFEKTTASAKIWSDWAGFEEGLVKLDAATKAAAAKGGAVGMDDMKPVFAACKACHDNYREK